MTTVRVGMIGAGAIATSQCRDIGGHPEARVVAVADVSEERANAVKAEFGLDKAYTRWQDMVRSKDIDAVTVALPNYLHAKVAIAALKAGKHVMLEKPFAMNMQEAVAVAAAAKAAKKVFMVGMNRRFTVETQTIKTLVDRGELGDIYHARAYWLRRTGSPRFGTWFTRKKLAGGGALLDIGVHALDMTLYLMNNFQPVAVSGVVYSKLGPRGLGEGGWGKSDRGEHFFDVDDFSTALIKMKNGASVTLEASWIRHQEEANYHNVELFGTEGGCKVFPATVFRFGKQAGEYEVVKPQNVPMKFANGGSRGSHWINVIQGKAKPECTVDQALTVQKILDGIYASAKTGKEVRIK